MNNEVILNHSQNNFRSNFFNVQGFLFENQLMKEKS